MVLLPLVITAYAVSYGRGLWVRLAAYASAVGLYLLLAWLRPNWAYDWGISIDLPLCTIAYVIAFIRPPLGRDPRAHPAGGPAGLTVGKGSADD
jgi:drug/metabolite transporter superfamily protein YnfA